MSIPYAYCVELGRMIDIIQARDAYFSNNEPRERFTFLCPDDKCREEFGPEIQGINYDKIPGIDRIVQRPHFRFKSHSIHSPSCTWAETIEARQEVERELNLEGRSLGKLKASELINVFMPRHDVEDVDVDSDDAGILAEISKIPLKKERMAARRKYIRSTINKSSRLHEVIHCFELMDKHELRTIMLRIGREQPQSYRNQFTASRFCTPTFERCKIYYGLANVRKWQGGYSVRFNRTSQQPDGADCTITTFIPIDQINRFRIGGTLKLAFDTAINKGTYKMLFYVYGQAVRLRDDTGGLSDKIDIHFETVHSIVVTLKENGE